MSVSFVIPIRTVSGLNVREHWAAKAKRVKNERKATAAAFPVSCRNWLGDAYLLRMRITLTRFGPRVMDSDNLTGATKSCRDEIARLLGLDDGSDRYEWVYRQERGPTSVLVEMTVLDSAQVEASK